MAWSLLYVLATGTGGVGKLKEASDALSPLVLPGTPDMNKVSKM